MKARTDGRAVIPAGSRTTRIHWRTVFAAPALLLFSLLAPPASPASCPEPLSIQIDTNDPADFSVYYDDVNQSPSYSQPPSDLSGRTWLDLNYDSGDLPAASPAWDFPRCAKINCARANIVLKDPQNPVCPTQTGACYWSANPYLLGWIQPQPVSGYNQCYNHGDQWWLRSGFSLPAGAQVIHAQVDYSVDNLATLYVNGTQATALPAVFWNTTATADVTGIFLGAGQQNVLGWKVVNKDQCSETGLTFLLKVEYCLPTETPTPSPTETPTDTASPSATPSATLTASPTVSSTFTASPTRTPTPSRTATRSATPTATLSATATHTATDTPSATRSLTPTASPTATPSATGTRTPSVTATPTRFVTDTSSPTPSATPSITPTSTPSGTPTATPSDTATSSPSSTPSATRSATPTSTRTSSATQTPSVTRTSSVTATATPTMTPTATPSTTGTSTRTATPTATLTPSPTRTATDTSTPTSTRTITETFTVSPTSSSTPTVTPTVTPRPAFSVRLTVFNTAGEIVKVLSDSIPCYQEPGGLDALGANFVPDQGGQACLDLKGTGQKQYWDGSGEDGKIVTSGPYLVVAQVKDTFGETTSYNATVTVVRLGVEVEVSIYNSAGERVRYFLVQAPAGTANALDLSSAQMGPGQGITIDYGGGSLAWDGASDLGHRVQAGSYLVKVTSAGRQGGVFTGAVTVLNSSGRALEGAKAVPNPVPSGSSQVSILLDPSTSSATLVSARIYNLAGELVTEIDNQSHPDRLLWQLQGKDAPGIYLIRLTAKEEDGQVSQRTLKAALRGR